MSIDLHDNRCRINRYLDELEQLARDVDSYLAVHRAGFEGGIEFHREQLEIQLERVRKLAAPKEGGSGG